MMLRLLGQLVACSLRGHDPRVTTHPVYRGMALHVCRRCGRGVVWREPTPPS